MSAFEVYCECLWRMYEQIGSYDSGIKSSLMNVVMLAIPPFTALRRQAPAHRGLELAL
jgi:hypothetical protein